MSVCANCFTTATYGSKPHSNIVMNIINTYKGWGATSVLSLSSFFHSVQFICVEWCGMVCGMVLQFLFVYFVYHCHPYIFLILVKYFLLLVWERNTPTIAIHQYPEILGAVWEVESTSSTYVFSWEYIYRRLKLLKIGKAQYK